MSVKRVALAIINTSIRIMILAVVVVYVYRTALIAYDFGYRVFAEEPMGYGNGIDIEVTVPMGKSVREVGVLLKEYGLIRDENLFVVQEMLSSYHGKINPGTYQMNTTMTAEELLAVMSVESEDSEDSGDN